jgi:hypothetical protein
MHRSLALAALLFATPALAQPDGPVTVVVAITTPPGATRAIIEGGMTKAIPLYEKIPGLIRKYFTIGDTSFGGVYLWRNRAAAQAWFSDAWRAKAKATYGSDPQVTYYDVPIVLEGKAAGSR